MDGLVDRRGRLVVPTGEDQRGDANLAEAGGDVPCFNVPVTWNSLGPFIV